MRDSYCVTGPVTRSCIAVAGSGTKVVATAFTSGTSPPDGSNVTSPRSILNER